MQKHNFITNLAYNVHVYVYFTTGHKVPSQWPYSLCVVTGFSVCKPVKAVIDWLKDLGTHTNMSVQSAKMLIVVDQHPHTSCGLAAGDSGLTTSEGENMTRHPLTTALQLTILRRKYIS